MMMMMKARKRRTMKASMALIEKGGARGARVGRGCLTTRRGVAPPVGANGSPTSQTLSLRISVLYPAAVSVRRVPCFVA